MTGSSPTAGTSDRPPATSRGSRRRATALALATVAYLGAAGLLAAAPVPLANRIALFQTFALFACGALIVRRTTAPLVGWLLIVPGVSFNFIYAFDELAPTVRATDWQGLLASTSYAGVLCLALLLLVFPNGRLETATARVLAGLAIVAAVLVAGGFAVDPEAGFAVMTATFTVVVIGALVDHARRYRRRPRVEQLQLKWFLVAIIGQLAYPAMLLADVSPGTVTFAVFDNAATMLWPVTILIAITRFRLFEIDRIISRTVSYATVTLILVALYASFVVGLGSAVRLATGGTGGDLVIAVSTLVVAAVFRPVRVRVQRVVDRRFDRTRYDAQHTVAAFAQQLRDEVDLDALAGEIQTLTAATMRPRHVSVWLRASEPLP